MLDCEYFILCVYVYVIGCVCVLCIEGCCFGGPVMAVNILFCVNVSECVCVCVCVWVGVFVYHASRDAVLEDL